MTDSTGTLNQGASCAHKTVKHAPVIFLGRSMADRWACSDCKQEFFPVLNTKYDYDKNSRFKGLSLRKAADAIEVMSNIEYDRTTGRPYLENAEECAEHAFLAVGIKLERKQ